jgi:hypothetical protein
MFVSLSVIAERIAQCAARFIAAAVFTMECRLRA